MNRTLRTRTAVICIGVAATVGIVVLASRGDAPSPSPIANGSTTGPAEGSQATSPDARVTAPPDATEASVPGAPGSSSASGPSPAVSTVRSAVTATIIPGGAAPTNSNVASTVGPATGTIVSSTLSTVVPDSTGPQPLRLFFLKVVTTPCDAAGRFSWSVELVSAETPSAAPSPDRVSPNPQIPRGWDVSWNETYHGAFTSPLTVISAGGESFTVPVGEAAQPANCP